MKISNRFVQKEQIVQKEQNHTKNYLEVSSIHLVPLQTDSSARLCCGHDLSVALFAKGVTHD